MEAGIPFIVLPKYQQPKYGLYINNVMTPFIYRYSRPYNIDSIYFSYISIHKSVAGNIECHKIPTKIMFIFCLSFQNKTKLT